MGPYEPLKIYFVQVKYTNRNESNLIRTLTDAEPAAVNAMYAFLINGSFLYKREDPQKKSDFFWIKSSAKRAFGGCLGSKRR